MGVTETAPAGQAQRPKLPPWALDAIQLYESNAANQFLESRLRAE